MIQSDAKLAQYQVQQDLHNQKVHQMEHVITQLELSNKEKDTEIRQYHENEQVKLRKMVIQYEKLLEEERQKAKTAIAEKDVLLAEWEKKRASEIETLDLRMRSLFSKKDDLILELREQLDAKQERMKEIESFMERQQRELFR